MIIGLGGGTRDERWGNSSVSYGDFFRLGGLSLATAFCLLTQGARTLCAEAVLDICGSGDETTLKIMILAMIINGRLFCTCVTTILDTLESVEQGQIDDFVTLWKGFLDKPKELQEKIGELKESFNSQTKQEDDY